MQEPSISRLCAVAPGGPEPPPWLRGPAGETRLPESPERSVLTVVAAYPSARREEPSTRSTGADRLAERHDIQTFRQFWPLRPLQRLQRPSGNHPRHRMEPRRGPAWRIQQTVLMQRASGCSVSRVAHVPLPPPRAWCGWAPNLKHKGDARTSWMSLVWTTDRARRANQRLFCLA